ncbi:MULTISPECIES: HdeD family acid-resistance protein [Lactobacillus]|uniref:Integral membrane protein n=1 Tax=Lactobacillus xujianguonis TaxID=2495899 RepID=A0A437STV0_9LACO|nr:MULTISPECIES: DUF308 domain-containing protein [Lactobacillus]RVU70272.1 hypothetical protein EJK17_08490 [Lactobacillus xujianguonis]RVU73310.1 hypothetical protein EJK20_08890 [Lactobacillus xujianguonis]
MDIFSSSRNNRGFDWGALIAGILMIVAAFLLLRHPEKGLHAFVLIFAVLSIVQGVVWISAYTRFRDFFVRSWVTLVSGILDIIIGILFLCSYDIGGLTIAYLFAIWFFVDSVVGIVFSWHLKDFSNGYFLFNLIMNILSLILAFFLILNPVLAALSLIWLVAFWLLVFGINEIVVAWMHR